MARWVNLKGENSSLLGSIEYDRDGGSQWQIKQDIQPFLDQAKHERSLGESKSHYKKVASIPQVVAEEIKIKWGVDLYDPTFMHDQEKKAKVFALLETEYPHLKSSDKRII